MTDPAPTRRDATRAMAETSRDPGPASAPAVTRRDEPGVRASGGLPEPVLARYAPLRSLGTGGEAHRVMLVEDRADGTHRVVKVYGAAVRPNPALVAALRAGDPAHLVGVLEWGEHTDEYGVATSWEVLEYVAGGSLRDLINDHQSAHVPRGDAGAIAAGGPGLPPSTVERVLAEVAAALTYLHRDIAVGGSTGLAHRDVKPENILVRSRDPLDLVLCDFGLVAEIRATRLFSRRAGTPLYQAPETFWRKSQEPAQDWWALGVMVVEMLTGTNPNAGVGGTAPDEDVLFEQIATRGVDLAGVTDPRWLLLCRGLLIRAPERRWGADQVARWRAGDTPDVEADLDDVRPPAARRRPPGTPPFELAGRACATPAELAATMGREWPAAADLFSDPDRLRHLADWLGEHAPDAPVPTDLLRRPARHQAEADRRVARFISYVDPGLPPTLHGRPADAAGIAVAARAALAGDAAGARFVERVDLTLLRAFARHRCDVHPECTGEPGCVVLESVAAGLSPAETALADRLTRLNLTGPGGRERRQQLYTRAALLLGLLEEDYLDHLRDLLARNGPAARSPWWRELRDEGDLVGLVLATALADAAIAEVAEGDAAAARERAERRELRRQEAAARRREHLASLRGLPRDIVSWMLAVILTYFTTYIAGAIYEANVLRYSAGNAVVAARQLAAFQTALALPAMVLLAAVLIRPLRPVRAARWAVAWAIGLAAYLALALAAGRPGLVGYPIVLRSGVGDALRWLDSLPGTWFAVAVIPALIVAWRVSRRLVDRAYATPAGPDARPVRIGRAVLVAVVLLPYLVNLLAEAVS